MNRRNFLQFGSAALFIGFSGCSLIPPIPSRPAPSIEAAFGWIRFENDTYTLFLPRVEMGQGIEEGLQQIACAELEIPLEALNIKYQITTQMDLVKATVGSDSIREFAIPLAQAAASIRDAIRSGKKAGEIDVLERPIQELNLFKNKSIIGHSTQLVKGLDIVVGKPLFSADISLPNMIFGRVVRAPISLERKSVALQWNEKAAQEVTGFIAIIQDDRLQYGQSVGLGILAQTPSALDKIEEALDIKWQTEKNQDPADINSLLRQDTELAEQTPTYTLTNDSLSDVRDWSIDLEYSIPACAHNPIEPRASLANVTEDKVEVWCGSQDVFYIRDVLCRHLQRDEDDVTVHSMRVGGGFGSRTICTVELEAAILSSHVNHPVKVQWTRLQEIRQGFMRPPSISRLRLKTNKGKITHWQHHTSSSHILFTNAALPKWMQAITDIFVGDKGVARGALPTYEFEKTAIGYDLTRLPIHTGPWRGLGAGPNCLMIESAIDEAAYFESANPLDFRLKHIKDNRLANVLRRVAETADWAGNWHPSGAIISTGKTGWGIAAGVYKDMTYAAVIAKVVISNSGDITVTELFCAQDCGLVINPDRVRAQIEGNLIWGLAMVLKDNQPIWDGAVTVESISEIDLPRLPEIPPMNIELVHSSHAPTGAGESAIVAAPAAIANAIRNATSVRPTHFPIGSIS